MNKKKKPLTSQKIEQALDGNLCRCTGYRPIVESFKKAFACDNEQIEDIESCGDISKCHDTRTKKPCGKLCNDKALQLLRAGQGQIKGKEKKKNNSTKPLHFFDQKKNLNYEQPTTLLELEKSLMLHPNAKIISANTGMGVFKYYSESGPTGCDGQPKAKDTYIIDVSNIYEMSFSPLKKNGDIIIAANTTVKDVIQTLEHTGNDDMNKSYPFALGIARHLKRVAGTQVRSAGTWTGNICLAALCPSFPSDILTVFAAAGSSLTILPRRSKSVKETIALGEPKIVPVDAFVASTTNPKSCIITNVTIPLIKHGFSDCNLNWTFFSDKTAQRHTNAHAIVNAGIIIGVEMETSLIKYIRIVFGGLVNNGLFVANHEMLSQCICGKIVSDKSTLLQTTKIVLAQAKSSPANGGIRDDEFNSKEFRINLVESFLYKAFLKAQPSPLPSRLLSAVNGSLACAEDRPPSSASHFINVGDKKYAPVGKAMPKLTNELLATGEATFISDLPRMANEMCGAYIVAPYAGYRFDYLDLSNVYSCFGVLDVIVASDFKNINGKNDAGTSDTTPKYLLEIGDLSPCVGAAIGLVLANSLQEARFAAKQAKIEMSKDHTTTRSSKINIQNSSSKANFDKHNDKYRDYVKPQDERFSFALKKLALTSFSQRSRIDLQKLEQLGELEKNQVTYKSELISNDKPITISTTTNNDKKISGSFYSGAQKHFFLETHTAYAQPIEDGKLIVHAATQSQGDTQKAISLALGIPQNKIDVRIRRIGGAYGGKIFQNQPMSVLASLAAMKHGVPIRIHNERCDDMEMTGGRPALDATYNAVISNDGVISSLEMDLQFDSGCMDGAGGLGDLGLAQMTADNVYGYSNFKCSGGFFHTQKTGATACRGPGVIQVVLLHEYILEVAAEAIKKDIDDVREINFYKPGDKALNDVVIGENGFDWNIPKMWNQAKSEWEIKRLRDENVSFNNANRWRKRGLSFIPTKYVIGLGGYKETAHIQIFEDGSVHVAHGGIELGQGIHTKVAQAVAYGLKCPLEFITVGDTSSISTYGTCTGGSGTSESCVMAALNACEKLMSRINYIPNDWKKTCKEAIDGGINLSEIGWFGPGTKAKQSAYASQGIGMVQVELDILTGEMVILKTNILMDFGNSLNPAVDLGQLEGAFIMALGLFFTEQVIWKNGKQLTQGSFEYKIPNVQSIPLEWNVTFLKSKNQSPEAVLGSKASGEPPMLLACAAFFAAREAIKAARQESQISEPLKVSAPLTVEQIRRACSVESSQFDLS